MNYIESMNPDEDINQFFGSSNTTIYDFISSLQCSKFKNGNTIESTIIESDDDLKEEVSTTR